MKILAIHADFIEFQAKKKAIPSAENVSTDKQRVEECLVIFTAVEKSDEQGTDKILQNYIIEVEKIAKQLETKNLVVYPYAHLSPSLSNPKVADQFLKDAQKALQDKGHTVARAPFGWYKSFNYSCKGHPLSELSRTITLDSTGLKKESKDKPFEFSSEELSNEKKFTLTTAALVGLAIKELYPNTEIGTLGFYQDQAYVDIANTRLNQDHLKKIQKKVRQLLKEKLSIKESSDDQLSNKQQQIKQELPQAKAYDLGSIKIVSRFKDPFVQPSEIGAFKLLNAGSAYWKQNENNEQLARVYCVGFSTKEGLEQYEKKLEEAHNRSHLKIGKEQGLFVVSKLVGPGLPLLAPNGMIIRQEIVDFLWSLHKDEGYKRVWTPHIAKNSLYKTSGHWDKFGDELFHVKGKTDSFVMKPMNCPHHMQIFDSFSLSYRDMPVRFFEPATIYRDEKSGQLLGLSRVRAITQDDGHLFCRISQITEEAKKIVTIIHKFYNVLGMDKDYWVSLSVRDDDKDKYLGSDEAWEVAEKALKQAADEMKLPYKRIEGEAAFYGPKLDFMFKDAMGREWQLATVQCDFNLPERFDLSFMNEEGKKERPVVIHRAISGSLERFMSVLIEHFAGKFPLWLSPMQVKFVTVNDSCTDFANEVAAKMKKHDLRVEVDSRTETIGRKVRDAQLEQANYIITIGEKEVANRFLAIRTREGEVKFEVPVDKFIKQIVDERDNRKL